MKRNKLAAVCLTTIFAIITAVYISRYNELLSNTMFLIPPLLAVGSGIFAISTYKSTSPPGRVVSYITAGLLSLFIGETLFYLYQFVWHTSPYPSPADIFYLASYPLIFTGLMKEIINHKVSLRNFNKLFLTLIGLIVLSLTVLVAYFGVYLAYKSGDPFASNAIAIAYGIGDLILIIPGLFVLKIALDFRGGKLFNSWILILLALVSMMAGDILFAINKDSYTALRWPAPLIDLAWVASYLFYTYSFFYTATTIKELRTKLIK